MYSCRGVYIVGEDCIWFSSFVFCSRDWSSDFLWVCFGAEKAVWARVPGMLSPHAPRAWASLSLSTSPSLSRSTPASVQHCTLFLWGRSLSLSTRLLISDQAHILQWHRRASRQFAVHPHSNRVLCVLCKVVSFLPAACVKVCAPGFLLAAFSLDTSSADALPTASNQNAHIRIFGDIAVVGEKMCLLPTY